MKTTLIILLNLAALLAGACASQSTTPTQANTVPVDAAKLSPSQEYVNYVMKHAEATGAEVHWLNVPEDKDLSKPGF